MDVVLFGLVTAVAVLSAYSAGKRRERRQVWKWLRFMSLEAGLREVSPHQLSAMLSAGQHWDLTED